MDLKLHALDASGTGEIAVSDEVFAREFNEGLVHQVVTAYRATMREGTKAQKTRSDVRGGGSKPWRQKGTGRARAGTIRSPIWRGGGRTFAAKPRNFKQKVNKKMYRGALRSILSELIRQGRFVAVKTFDLDQAKTKLAVNALRALDASDALIITDNVSDNLYLSVRNIPKIGLIETSGIDPVLLISHDKIIITEKALGDLEAALR